MSIGSGKAIERSVDSLEKIYAVVIAFAISQAVQILLKGPNGVAELKDVSSGLPGFVAFSFTLVPFWHGMNRHLDRCYLEKADKVVQGALLLDFGTFFLEASLLFAAGWSLRSGIASFVYLGALLVVDMLWGFIAHQIHFPGKKSDVKLWAAINVPALVLAILIVAYPFQQKPWVLMIVAILRSVVDYWLCWDFYFPIPPPAETGATDPRRLPAC
jgi:hypothetical protein